MGTLRDRMLVDLQLSGAKPSTQRSYLREAENLAKYFHKSPEQLGGKGKTVWADHEDVSLDAA